MLRRPSMTESNSSGDVNFDDVDDTHVFAYMDEGDDGTKPPRTVEFRLDFSSSRVNPAPAPMQQPRRSIVQTTTTTMTNSSAGSSSPRERRASLQLPPPAQANASSRSKQSPSGARLQRTPSMRSPPSPVKKRLSKRPSEPLYSATPQELAAMLMPKIQPPLESLDERAAGDVVSPPSPVTSASSPSRSSPPSPSDPPTTTTTFTTASRRTSLSNSQQDPPSTYSERASAAERAAAAAMATASATNSLLDKAHAENETLRCELTAARVVISDLQQRLRVTEQTNESLTHQLTSVQDMWEQKLRDVHSSIEVERAALLQDKEHALHDQQTRAARDLEALRSELAAMTKIKSEVHTQNERLLRALDEQTSETQGLERQCLALQSELKRERDEVAHLTAWKQRQHETDATKSARCDELEAMVEHWETQCQAKDEQVHELLREQDTIRAQHAIDCAQRERRHTLKHALHERFVLEVQLLRAKLKELTVETKSILQQEMKKTHHTLTRVQQQTCELAIQQNDRAMALVSKQNRIIQLETQLKNERQSVHQLETALAKTTRTLERKDAAFKAKFQEQREFLDITVAVRNGLTTELQVKKKQVAELEQSMKELTLAKERADRKNKHLTQQVKIMQHMHTRELEKYALQQSGASATTMTTTVARGPTAVRTRLQTTSRTGKTASIGGMAAKQTTTTTTTTTMVRCDGTGSATVPTTTELLTEAAMSEDRTASDVRRRLREDCDRFADEGASCGSS